MSNRGYGKQTLRSTKPFGLPMPKAVKDDLQGRLDRPQRKVAARKAKRRRK